MSLIVKSIVNVSEAQTILIILSEYITLLLRLEVRVLKLVSQAVLLIVLRLWVLQTRVTILQLSLSQESPLLQLIPLVLQLTPNSICAKTREKIHPQFDDNLIKRMIFLLHLLMMTSTLLGLPSLYKISHAFENLVSPPEIFVDKMFVMQL